MPRQKMSDAEKVETRAVRDYLTALETNRLPKFARKRTPDSVRSQIEAATTARESASGTKRLGLVQERIDLEAELDRLESTGSVDMGALESAFAANAASYGGKRGISYAAWREVGVPSPVLKAAGIRRSA